MTKNFDKFFYRFLFESINDDEYLRLASDPEKNQEELQRMVDDAAKASRYGHKLYTAQQENSLNAFNFKMVGKNENGITALGPGIYLLDSKRMTQNVYSKRGPVYDVFLHNDALIIDIFSNDQNHWKNIIDRLDLSAKDAGYESYDKMPRNGVSNLRDGRGPVGIFVKLLGRERTRELFIKHGIHGSKEELPSRVYEYAIYDPSKIKSADPITYNNGNIIPLSQRFDPSKDDIRY
jgi:hypothetical protein